MNPTEPTVEQATAYFRDMVDGKSVTIAPGRSKGLGVVHTPASYPVTTPTDQALAQAREVVERRKVIRGPGYGKETKKALRGPTIPSKRKKKNPTKETDYSMPGLE